MLTKKGEDFSKLNHILCWSETTEYVPPPVSKSVLYRIPNKQLKDISNFTEVGVAKSEVCFVYSKGKLDGPYQDGLYDISPELLESGASIFFISLTSRKWKIEVPEDIERAIGTSVDLSQFTVNFSISDPNIFLTRGLDYSWDIDTEKAYTWITSLIVSSIGDISRTKDPEEVTSLMNDATRNQELISLIQSELDLMGVSISELSTGATIAEGALEEKAMSSIGVASSTIMREIEKLEEPEEEAEEDLMTAMSSISEETLKVAKPADKRGRKLKAKKKLVAKEKMKAEPAPPPLPVAAPPSSAPKSAPAPSPVPPSSPSAGAAPPSRVISPSKVVKMDDHAPPAPPSPMPKFESLDEEYKEVDDEFAESKYTEGTYEYETTIIERETMISYYERMHIWKTFPLEVIISSEEIRATVVKSIARIKSKLEVEVEEDEKPIVRIVPIFPGCLISPIDAFVNLDDDFSQTVFYLTPTTLGKHNARIEFWKDEHKIGEEEIDLKVVKTRLAKISLTAGIASLIPNVATAVGYDMNSAAEESISSKNDILSEIVATLGGMMIFLFALFIFFSSMSGLIFYLLRPKKDTTSLSIF
jgi:hypothetical protein